MRRFGQFACIDWSGEAVARPRGLAVAVTQAADRPPVLLRPGGGWSRQGILDWLRAHAAAKSDLLIGVDFSPALPFVDRGAYLPGWREEIADARSLWRLVDETCTGDAFLGVGSFVAHEEASPHFRRQVAGAPLTGSAFPAGAGRLRQVESACRAQGLGNASSCFNLVGAAQVGKSSLTGMRVLHRLDGAVPVWPIDPIPVEGPVIVEIYTSLAARAAGLRHGLSKMRDAKSLAAALASFGLPSVALDRHDDHSTDALVTAAWLRRAAENSALWSPAGLTPAIAATEGWTFGVA